jgi:hypothetical protein
VKGIGQNQRTLARKVIMTETNQDKLEKGEKQRAGTLLSNFIRQILQERTTYVDTDAKTEADIKMLTKAEAIARTIIDRALGKYTYHDEKTDEWKVPPPDKRMLELIYDRVEGRVGTYAEEKEKQAEIPDKVSRANEKVLNQMATETQGE